MAVYMEYIKGGDILIAPALEYKHQYVLKCGLCEDYFADFEYFHSHYLSHYDLEFSIEDDVESYNEKDNLSQLAITEEEELYDNIIVGDSEDNNKVEEYEENIDIQRNEYKADEEQCPLRTIAENKEAVINSVAYRKNHKNILSTIICDTNAISNKEFSDYESIKYETTIVEVLDMDGTLDQEFDPTVLEEEKSDQCEEEPESVETNKVLIERREVTSIEKKSINEFVKKFLNSKEDVTALIDAYRSETHLWNFNLPTKYRKKVMRTNTWEKIAANLKDTRNLTINSDQVAACLVYLRHKYRERKRHSDLVAKHYNDVLPTWAFKQLHFLNAFVESKPVAVLDIHQDLSPKQTIHILSIFQRCSHLWDTNTAEYFCTNKRNEAFIKMKNIVTEEMDLEVEEDALRNYLQRVLDYVVLDKRRQFGQTKVEHKKVKCHKYLLFLYDHVGPFKCSHCQRTVISTLALKACEAQHTGSIPFKCPECSKDFKNVDTFVYHMRRHMGDLRKECNECGKKFLRLSDLEEHRRRHTGAKPFCCEICGASFRQRTGFGMHMKRHEKRYISFCPFCSKGFYSKDSMQMHAKSHTDERDFVCTICGKAFKTRKTLKSHTATHENGNYECTICGKCFKNKVNLWQHKRKHRLKTHAQSPTDIVSLFENK